MANRVSDGGTVSTVTNNVVTGWVDECVLSPANRAWGEGGNGSRSSIEQRDYAHEVRRMGRRATTTHKANFKQQQHW